jgi:hypothetical protein
MRFSLSLLCLLFISFFTINGLKAATGDTIHVITHDSVLIQTDGSGSTRYPRWASFPPASKQFRKVIVMMTYNCPPGLHCGEWDYINSVWLRRKGGTTAPSMDLELVRFITPYGYYFPANWKFAWDMDITDYQAFLHDSIEIEYQHTGYEGSADRGWLVTLDFMLIEGKPSMDFVKMDNMWDGGWTYGNDADPIESHLVPITKTMDPEADLARLRINQTGHGNDTFGCSEFCYPQRDILMDGAVFNTRTFIRKCGDNPLYPQGGTWIYDRGNWCPGSVIFPDLQDFKVAKGSTHTFDINLEPYSVRAPSGNYYFHSQLLQFKRPWANNDASIEEIVSPSTGFEYSRLNPVCSNPKIIIKNQGDNRLTSAVINYGIDGQPSFTHYWNGNLVTGQSAEVELGNLLLPDTGHLNFRASISWPNGHPDEYSADDTASSRVALPPVHDSVIIFNFRSNNYGWENSYTLIDDQGNALYHRDSGSLGNNVVYRDTFHLEPGCYRLIFKDAGGDGLSFWANPGQGTGYARLLKKSAAIIKTFQPDCGNTIFWSFRVGTPDYRLPSGIAEEKETNSFIVFPNPSSDMVFADIRLAQDSHIHVRVLNTMGQVLSEREFMQFKEDRIGFDVSGFSKGIYYMQISDGVKTECRKFVVE